MKSSFYIRIVNGVLWGLFAGAVGISLGTLASGPFELKLLAGEIAELRLSLGLSFDTLSSLLLVMVTLLGAVIGQYSVRYLDGEKGQTYFYRYLLFTVSSVALLISSSNLLMFFLMWLATSYGLHKLLIFYSDRPQAVEAARKKFLISRIGDLCLLLAIGLTYQVFRTLEFSEIFKAADVLSVDSVHAAQLSLIGFLFALGAMTKSAQFPFHFWLPDTMETPTPVSALMHAGIINAGGFLMIRLSPLLQHAPEAHLLLILMGACTAVFGSLVMITQSNIKRKLAYSTISQMGMMMFACGLGAYSIALFHMIAHSFYKAHAFLSTGQMVEETKKTGFKPVAMSMAQFTFWALIGVSVLAAGLFYKQGSFLGYFAYAAVLVLGLAQNMSLKSRSQGNEATYSTLPVLSRVGLVLATAIGIFACVEIVLHRGLSELVPIIWDTPTWSLPYGVAVSISYLIFALGLWLSAQLMGPGVVKMPRLYTYLWNGGYFSYRSSRLLQRFSSAS